MAKAQEVFHQLASLLPDAKESSMFGAPCLKVPSGKAAIMLYREDMVFKLEGEALKNALNLPGAHLFNPMGDRPMGGWVQLSLTHQDKWLEYAKKAFDYVKTIKK
jgi:hypothetical protein